MAVARGTAFARRTRTAGRVRADRIFFGAMALACGAAILGGFAPTFYLRGALSPGSRPLAPTVVVHGTIFTAWVLLFLAQTALVPARRVDWHRRLGLASVVVVPAMVAVGVPLIAGFERSHGAEPALTLAVHLFGNVAPLTLFAAFAAAGFWLRARPEVHKRLMLFATLALEPAGFARLIGYLGFAQSLNMPVYAALCGACVAYDALVDRRVRAVTVVGVALLLGEYYATDALFAAIGF